MEEPRALPLPPEKGGPSKELCNHGSAFGPASSPHSACPGDHGASNQADMFWKETMKEGGDEGAEQPPPQLSAPGRAKLPTPKGTSSAQGVSYRHRLPHSLSSAFPASGIGPSATFLILLGHGLPPPLGVHPLAPPGCGSIASLPRGTFVCPSPPNSQQAPQMRTHRTHHQPRPLPARRTLGERGSGAPRRQP